MLAVLLVCMLCQDPGPKEPPKPAPAPQPAPTPAPTQNEAPKSVEVWDDRAAKEALDAFAKVMKGTPSMAQKSRALDALGAGSNKLLCRPLAQVVETDKSIV